MFSADEWMTRPFVIVIAIILAGAIVVPHTLQADSRAEAIAALLAE